MISYDKKDLWPIIKAELSVLVVVLSLVAVLLWL